MLLFWHPLKARVPLCANHGVCSNLSQTAQFAWNVRGHCCPRGWHDGSSRSNQHFSMDWVCAHSKLASLCPPPSALHFAPCNCPTYCPPLFPQVPSCLPQWLPHFTPVATHSGDPFFVPYCCPPCLPPLPPLPDCLIISDPCDCPHVILLISLVPALLPTPFSLCETIPRGLSVYPRI